MESLLWFCSTDVLDEEGEESLINVNMIDDEHYAKNVENKKKRPDYKPYDEPELDEYGMVLLEKIFCHISRN